MTPLALDLLIRTRVIALRDEALAGAITAQGKSGPHADEILSLPTSGKAKPRPVLVLPDHAGLRRSLIDMIVHRPAQH
jgi:hypothetical protein